jgi:hypothetical protein
MRVAIGRVYAVSEIGFVNLPRRFDEKLFSIEGDDLTGLNCSAQVGR